MREWYFPEKIRKKHNFFIERVQLKEVREVTFGGNGDNLQPWSKDEDFPGKKYDFYVKNLFLSSKKEV